LTAPTALRSRTPIVEQRPSWDIRQDDRDRSPRASRARSPVSCRPAQTGFDSY
jgi:hypothetical protein